MTDETLWKQIQGTMTRRGFLAWKAAAQRVRYFSGQNNRHYVFVAGVQRSGTNMIMDVLERSYETEVIHERDQRAFDNYRMRERPRIQRLAERSPAPVFVIKALCELQELRSLMDEFTPAKALWVMRGYEDVVNSMLVSFRNQAKQVQRIVADRHGDDWWLGKGMSDETFMLLQKLLHPDISNASAAALQWYFRNILFFEQNLDRDPRVMAVSYESLVTDPQDRFRRIFDFLGLKFTPRVAGSVFASSIRRRTPPEIEPAVREICEDLSLRIARAVSAGNNRD